MLSTIFIFCFFFFVNVKILFWFFWFWKQVVMEILMKCCLFWSSCIIFCYLVTRGKRKNRAFYTLVTALCGSCSGSVSKWGPALFNLRDYRMAGLPVLHYLLEIAQTHVHWVSDAIWPSHPVSPPSPIALNLSQHQGLFQCLSPVWHQVAKVLELQLQHQSFQWVFRVDFL